MADCELVLPVETLFTTFVLCVFLSGVGAELALSLFLTLVSVRVGVSTVTTLLLAVPVSFVLAVFARVSTGGSTTGGCTAKKKI